jgi:putative (di)nucleoside polyphosphate hydrolase
MAVALASANPRKLQRLPMRPSAGILLFNREGLVWVGRRRPKWARYRPDYVSGHIWQPPQGGIGPAETPKDAALRELHEETGITSVTVLGELPVWLGYELPDDLLGLALKGKYAGQRFRWFAMRFEGDESEIDIAGVARAKSEFDAWRWIALDELPSLSVPFKRPMYDGVAQAFAPLTWANLRLSPGA